VVRRFYFDPASRSGDLVQLSPEQARHAVRVLRLKSGSRLELLDGLGTVYSAVLTVSGEKVAARLDQVVVQAEESGRGPWVAQGLLRGDKMDEVVQKCTELGVSRFSPLVTARCQGRPSPEQGVKKHDRWLRIAREACKQCLRPLPMQIDIPQELAQFLDKAPSWQEEFFPLLFWEEEKNSRLRGLAGLAGERRPLLLLGPEGGLTQGEAAAAADAGFRAVSLGTRILRAETATLAAVAIIQHLSGEI
jgi:16S rRNA (uracil1498-N3)-methyltransferase